MVKITHPTMGRGAGPNVSSSPSQNFVVEDATNMPKDARTIDEHIKRFEAQPEAPAPVVVEAPQPVNPNKARLESLLFIGRLTTELDLYGHRFEISSLTNKEHNQMVKELYKFGDGADLFTIRVLTLAHALRSIDGVPLDDVAVEGEFANPYYRRMAILDNMQLALVEKLYEEYSKLIAEVEEVSQGEEIKK